MKKELEIYQEYVLEQVPAQIDAFMRSGKADKYLKSTKTKDITCCKDIIGSGYDNSKGLLDNNIFRSRADYNELKSWSGVIDASSLSALSSQVAVESVDKIVKAADKISKAEHEALIINFISGLLFFNPFVRDVLHPELAAVRGLIRLTDEVGNAALSLYDVVKGPKNSRTAVFSYLVGSDISSNALKGATEARRAMKSDGVKSLGSVKTNLDKIENVRVKVCSIG